MSTAVTKLPLRLGCPDEFASVREFFSESGFDDASLCRALGMDDMSDLGRVQWNEIRMELVSPAIALHFITRIFSLTEGTRGKIGVGPSHPTGHQAP